MKQTVSSPRRLELPRNAAEWLEAIMNFLFFLCGILAVGCVVLISAYMILSGVPNLGSAAVEAHSVPNRNRNRPICRMAGTPERIM